MAVPPEISWSLEIGSGVLWTLVYILSESRAFAAGLVNR